MALSQHAWTAQEILNAEQPLLETQAFDDELMRSAAHGVAEVARAMLAHRQADEQPPARILVLSGSGGNGGDALYAVAELLTPHLRSCVADALLLGRDGAVQQRALAAFTDAGGRVVRDRNALQGPYDLIIDGVLGLGASGGLREEAAEHVQHLLRLPTPILSVDVPSGIDADTGATPPPTEDGLATFIAADVTVTFGGLRYAHGLSPHCGEVVLVDARTHAGPLSTELLKRAGGEHLVTVSNLQLPTKYAWPNSVLSIRPPYIPDVEPAAEDNKYSGGVIGVAAGSDTYPGAAILATLGAVRTTPSMVRYAGPQALEVVRAAPEVVATSSIDAAGRVQAWLYGPGSGTSNPDDLAALLDSELPVLIDADGLTLLTEHPTLIEQVRSRYAATVLTPHAGEFQRLTDALGVDYSDTNRVDAACQLARELQSAIILKGRATVVATPGDSISAATAIDAGSSWAATPGSGDVLAGIAGALVAAAASQGGNPSAEEDDGFRVEYLALPKAVAIQAMAAWLSAQTPEGPAPTSASRIAAAVPRAIARLRGGRFFSGRGEHRLPAAPNE